MRFISILVSSIIFLFLFVQAGEAQRALFYETFDDFDARNGGLILPEGVELIRISGRAIGSEMEIEAPAGGSSFARIVPDPTGLGGNVLQLEDQETNPGDGSFGADGGLTLLESIVLDQGDHAGFAIVSWMAIPMQNDEPGGAMFPETDTSIDSGPEGLNLISFGGVTRDFDTGEPVPGQDFSGRIIGNQEGQAVLTDFGVGYQAGLPTFFTLLFDLEQSHYDIFINGLLVHKDMPFFDIDGTTGKTLRELELISTARGVGTFLYDNLVQIDPEAPHTPLPFHTPIIAEDSEWIPLFVEDFDDNSLGNLAAHQEGNLYGTELISNSSIEAVPDQSYYSLTCCMIPADSSLQGNFHRTNHETDPIRFSCCIIPQADCDMTVSLFNQPVLQLRVGEPLFVNQNGDTQLDSTDIMIYENLPHWFSIELDPATGVTTTRLYRATSETDAQTAFFEIESTIPYDTNMNSFTLSVDSGSAFADNLNLAIENQSLTNDEEYRFHAVVHKTFEDTTRNTIYSIDDQNIGTIVPDSSQWSFNALQPIENIEMKVGENLNLSRTAQLSWTAIPQQSNQEGSILKISYHVNGEQKKRTIAGFMQSGQIGVDQTGSGSLQAIGKEYNAGMRYSFQVSLDMPSNQWELYLNREHIMGNKGKRSLPLFYSASPQGQTKALPLVPHSQPEKIATGKIAPESGGTPIRLTDVSLSGAGNHSFLFDDILLTANPGGSFFEPYPYQTPEPPSGVNLLFEEDFENNPAGSERIVNEFDPRRSGLPIETRSCGLSDQSETDIEGTNLTIGAPSAEAAYIAAPGGKSLYSLYLADRFSPSEFTGFETALPFIPISTLRTVPYSFMVVEPLQTSNQRYVTLRWSATALQNDQTGLVLFLATQEAEIPLPQSSILSPAPSGNPITAFGEKGWIMIDPYGDGNLEPSSVAYDIGQPIRFVLRIDRQENMYSLKANEQNLAENVSLTTSTGPDEFLQRFGWFSTTVNTGNGIELQQSDVGGGEYIIDGIRLFQSDVKTNIPYFFLYQ